MAEWENNVGESDEWYTPRWLFDALGVTFDLDVASPGLDAPHCHVPARRCFTANDDGLSQPWHGFVWMNMPFGGRNAQVPWLEKFVEHGHGLGLARAYTSAGWFHDWMPRMDAIMFPRGKTAFVKPSGEIGKHPGSGIVLFGIGGRAVAVLRRCGLGIFAVPEVASRRAENGKSG